jgi:hypothetical protein
MAVVFAFMKVIIPYLKELHQDLGKVVHFTDSAVCQYKNFQNLLFHTKISVWKDSYIS